MKHYDQNGRLLSFEERRRRTESYREELFRRVLTPIDPCLGGGPCTRALSAQSTRVRSQSARSHRSRSAKVRRAEPLLSSPAIRVTVVAKVEEPDSPDEQTSDVGPHEIDMEREAEEPQSAPQKDATQFLGGDLKTEERERKVSKTSFGLRIAVADFTQKVIDNEGMGINTFTYLDEGAKTSSPPSVTVNADGEEVAIRTEQDRKISIRSYQQYRSSVMHLTVSFL